MSRLRDALTHWCPRLGSGSQAGRQTDGLNRRAGWQATQMSDGRTQTCSAESPGTLHAATQHAAHERSNVAVDLDWIGLSYVSKPGAAMESERESKGESERERLRSCDEWEGYDGYRGRGR